MFFKARFLKISLNGEGASPLLIPHPLKSFYLKKENDNMCESKGGIQ